MSALRLCGRLEADSQSRCDTSGNYSLFLRLTLPHEPPGQPVTVRAVKPYGTGAAAALACKMRARQLRQGVNVVLLANIARRTRGGLEISRIEDAQAPDITVQMRGSDQ